MAEQVVTLEIEGMHCEACVRRVTAALTRCGAGDVDAVSIGSAKVRAGEDAAPALVAALEHAGFPARVQSVQS